MEKAKLETEFWRETELRCDVIQELPSFICVRIATVSFRCGLKDVASAKRTFEGLDIRGGK